jgi:hypothetical protein
MAVPVGLLVVVIVLPPPRPHPAQRRLGDDRHVALHDPARAHQPIGGGLDLVGAPAHHDHLEAVVVIEVHVQRRAHLVAEVVLDVVQLLGQLAHVVVVDQRDRRHCRHALLGEHLGHLGPRQVAE